MSKLVRDDAGGNSSRGSGILQSCADFANQHIAAARPRQEQTARLGRARWTQRTEPVNYLTDQRVHGNPAFGAEFAERYVDGPLVGSERAQTIDRQIDTFADAHAGMTEK